MMLHPDLQRENIKYVINVADHLSKHMMLKGVPSKEAKHVKKALLDYFSHIGNLPKTVQSDNGSEFCNSTIEDLLKGKGIGFVHGRPWHPQS